MIASYSPAAPLTAAPDTKTTITAPAGTRAWFVSVSAQACYITFDGSTPSSTNGLTVPAGSVLYWPVPSNLTCLSATAGSLVNAVGLK